MDFKHHHQTLVGASTASTQAVERGYPKQARTTPMSATGRALKPAATAKLMEQVQSVMSNAGPPAARPQTTETDAPAHKPWPCRQPKRQLTLVAALRQDHGFASGGSSGNADCNDFFSLPFS